MAFHGSSNNIVQVKSTTTNSIWTASVGSNTYTEVGSLNISIAPKFSTSNVLLLLTVSYDWDRDNGGGGFIFYRGNTKLTNAIGNSYSNMYQVSSGMMANPNHDQTIMNNTLMFLDGPGTTSSITYKVRVHNCNDGGNRRIVVNGARAGNGTISNQWDDGRAISTYVAMEIAA